jgi:hypothetical protein
MNDKKEIDDADVLADKISTELERLGITDFWVSDIKISYGNSDFVQMQAIEFKPIHISEIIK